MSWQIIQEQSKVHSKGQKKSKWFFQAEKNEWILLYYYETSGRLVFIRFLEEIEATKKTFWN